MYIPLCIIPLIEKIEPLLLEMSIFQRMTGRAYIGPALDEYSLLKEEIMESMREQGTEELVILNMIEEFFIF